MSDGRRLVVLGVQRDRHRSAGRVHQFVAKARGKTYALGDLRTLLGDGPPFDEGLGVALGNLAHVAGQPVSESYVAV
ncbi:hypothetical protein D3C81_2099360 [compost metagenome]